MIEARIGLTRTSGFALDVDLQLPSRGATALFGPSGCGKTTLLRCLAGLERAAAGRITIDGEVWQDAAHARPAHARSVGVVFQDAALFPHLTVHGNLDFARRRAHTPVDLDPLIEVLELAPLLPRRPHALSGGERQRVAIARALAAAPRLLLMDEPLAALDAARKADFLPWLDRLRETLTVPLLYVSHAMDEVARIADHLVLMDRSRIVAHGAMEEMTARLDLPLHRAEGAGVVLPATVHARDSDWQLAQLDVHGHTFWARDPGAPIGAAVRLCVPARDVSLVLAPVPGSSIGNQLPARVEALADDSHPSLVMVRVRLQGPAGGPALLARLTRRSAQSLDLAPGREVWAQVKTVALTA